MKSSSMVAWGWEVKRQDCNGLELEKMTHVIYGSGSLLVCVFLKLTKLQYLELLFKYTKGKLASITNKATIKCLELHTKYP